MSNFKWQEEAIYKQMVSVRAPRQSGKTRAAVRWAGRAGEHVLYLVPHAQQIRYVTDVFQVLFSGEIEALIRAGLIVLKDGTHIHIHHGNDERMRGRNYDAVVLDEANYIDDKVIFYAFTRIKDNKIFATYTGKPNETVNLIEQMNGLERMNIDFGNPGKNISYKYLLEGAF